MTQAKVCQDVTAKVEDEDEGEGDIEDEYGKIANKNRT